MTKILTHDEIVSRAYYLIEKLLDATWQPTDKLKLLEHTVSHVERIAEAEVDAFLRCRDETLTDFERTVADRDMGILRTAANLLDDFMHFRQSDKQLNALLTPSQ